MKEKLEITNFAGIEHWEVELNSINILIGPQASGKSVTAKLFYFFKSIFNIITPLEVKAEKEQKEQLIQKFETYFPVHAWGDETFYIIYSNEIFWIKITRNQEASGISMDFSQELADIFMRYNRLLRRASRNADATDLFMMDAKLLQMQARQAFFRQLRGIYNNSIAAEQIFIPAGRSFFANMQSNIFTLLSGKQKFDPILLEFGSLYERIKPIQKMRPVLRGKIEYRKALDRLLRSILHGRYVSRDGEDYLIHSKGGRAVHINFASSGQQEVLPLALFLKYIMRKRLLIEDNEVVVYIEEPEAHLFPQSQKNIVEALALLANASTTKYQFIITTHSPYILASFNNLIEAGNVLNEFPSKQEELFDIVDEKTILKYEDINAYSLKDGACESIMDDEMKLISPTILDEVSNDISVQFGKLLDL